MQETWVRFLVWDDPLEKGKATHSGLDNSMNCIVRGVPKSRTRLSDFHFHFHFSLTRAGGHSTWNASVLVLCSPLPDKLIVALSFSSTSLSAYAVQHQCTQSQDFGHNTGFYSLYICLPVFTLLPPLHMATRVMFQTKTLLNYFLSLLAYKASHYRREKIRLL